VLLRRPRAEDIEDWMGLYLDQELCRYTGGAVPRQAAWSKVLAVAGAWDLLGFGPFSIVEIATGRWAGCAGPWRPPEWPGNELGWRLARWAQGKGYATEGARLALDWAFETLGWARAIHCIHPDNHASIRVAERLGSTLDGPVTLPGPPANEPLCCWSQSVADWGLRRRVAS